MQYDGYSSEASDALVETPTAVLETPKAPLAVHIKAFRILAAILMTLSVLMPSMMAFIPYSHSNFLIWSMMAPAVFFLAGLALLFFVASSRLVKISLSIWGIYYVLGIVINYNAMSLGDTLTYINIVMALISWYVFCLIIANSCDNKSASSIFILGLVDISSFCFTLSYFGIGLQFMPLVAMGIGYSCLAFAMTIISILCFWSYALSDAFRGQSEAISEREFTFSPVNRYGLAYLIGVILCVILF